VTIGGVFIPEKEEMGKWYKPEPPLSQPVVNIKK
jgi:hypothetical protein